MSQSILAAILALIDDYEQRRISVEELQLGLEANAGALDNSAGHVLRELKAVDADLEHMRFVMSPLEQRHAVLHRLQPLKEEIDRLM